MESSAQFRLALGLTQQQLGEFIGVSRLFLAQVESGRKSLPARALVQLSRFRQLLAHLPSAPDATEFPITFPKKEKAILNKISRLGLEADRMHLSISGLEQKMDVWQTALNLCRTLKTQDWVKADAQLLDAVDRFHEKTWIAWCEHGPRELRRLRFYLNQTLEERAFLERLAAEYGKGELSDAKPG